MEVVVPLASLYMVGEWLRMQRRAISAAEAETGVEALSGAPTLDSRDPLGAMLSPPGSAAPETTGVDESEQRDVPLQPFRSAYGARDELLAQAPVRLPDSEHATFRGRRKQLWTPRTTDVTLERQAWDETGALVGNLYGTPKSIEVRRSGQKSRFLPFLKRDLVDSQGAMVNTAGEEPGRAWAQEGQLPQRSRRMDAYIQHNYRQNELEIGSSGRSRAMNPMGYGGHARTAQITTRNKNVQVDQRPQWRSPFQKVSVPGQPDLRLNKDTTFTGRRGFLRGVGGQRPTVLSTGVEDKEDRVMEGRQPGVTASMYAKPFTGAGQVLGEGTMRQTDQYDAGQRATRHYGKRNQLTAIQDEFRGNTIVRGRVASTQRSHSMPSWSMGMGGILNTRRATTGIPSGRSRITKPTLPVVRTVSNSSGRDGEWGPTNNPDGLQS